MAYDVDHRPGAWVRAQAADRERLIWGCLAAGLLGLCLYIALVVSHRIGIVGAMVVLVLAGVARRYGYRFMNDTERWLRGAYAEESVGATLDALRREGWILMHDVEQAFEGNIDHIASGPNGVFMIETKARRYGDDDPRKAKRQAAKLHDELDVWVTPVICLHQRRGKPFRNKDGVAIVPVQHLLSWLRSQREKPVDFERLARFAERIN